MIEFLKHFFGICGESFHPNIWTILLGSTGITTALLYIKSKFKR